MASQKNFWRHVFTKSFLWETYLSGILADSDLLLIYFWMHYIELQHQISENPVGALAVFKCSGVLMDSYHGGWVR